MKTATAILLAVCLATVSAIALALCTGGRLNPAVALLALVCGAAGAIFYACTSDGGGGRLRLGWPEWAAIVLFALFALRAFCWVVFRSDDSIMVLSPNNLGDMPLHLTYIRNFAKGAAFWPENPIFSGIKLHYPAGIDIFNALWSLLGFDDLRVIVWVGLAASALTCYALLRWGGWFAVVGFLCNGGIAGWKFFHHFAFQLEDYQQAMAWKSIPLSMFVTQRGLLYAIPTGLLLMAVWRERWFRDPAAKSSGPAMPLWVQVALYSTLPLFHLHTFLFLSALLGWWMICYPRVRKEAVDLALWALLPATVFLTTVTGVLEPAHGAAAVLHLKPGWMQENEPFFHFWFGNFGFLPVAAAVWLALAWRRFPRSSNELAFVLPAVLVFLTACFVMFAPWEWDNTKIMIWSYLTILPGLGAMIREVGEKRRPIGPVLEAACCVALFFSGFISLAGGLDATHTGLEIARRSELEPVSFAVRFLPVESTFVGKPTYNHPLLLCGCKMAEGYPGHLVSHGIDYQARDDEVSALMMGSGQWRDIVRALGIRYLFWGALEEQAYGESTQPWKAICPVAASGSWGTIYEVAPPEPVPRGR